MGRIGDFFARLENKLDKPVDPDLLLSDDNSGDDGDLAEAERKERATKVRRQRRAKTMRWGNH